MRRVRTKLERLGLKIVKVPMETANVATEQVRPIVEYHLHRFSAWLSIREQMERLAFDAYLQGLIHGNQVPHVAIPTQGASNEAV